MSKLTANICTAVLICLFAAIPLLIFFGTTGVLVDAGICAFIIFVLVVLEKKERKKTAWENEQIKREENQRRIVHQRDEKELQARFESERIEREKDEITYKDQESALKAIDETEENPSAEVVRESVLQETVARGKCFAKRAELTPLVADRIQKRFIAFDVETTGLSSTENRIIEIGAVSFLDGKVEKVFSSLVNSGVYVPASVTAINHITNAMLSDAPSEKELYPDLITFLGDALHGDVIMCAHNAKFDFDFLCNTLSRLGFDADIEYVDTLSIARKYLKGLNNYKQRTLEAYFDLANKSAHRAASDAENCGHILWNLLKCAMADIEKEKLRKEKARPTQEEFEVCAYIQKMIAEQGGDSTALSYYRNSTGYVDAMVYQFNLLRMKIAKKGNYLIMKKDCQLTDGLRCEPCTKTEGGADYVRVLFEAPFELSSLAKYLYRAYSDRCRYAQSLGMDHNESDTLSYALPEENISCLLEAAQAREKSRKEAEKEREYALQAAIQKAEEKARAKAERAAKRESLESKPKKSVKRAVIQMDDEGNVIKEFASVTSAAKEVGVDLKGIRSAASGIQKHSGGFRWKYKEPLSPEDS